MGLFIFPDHECVSCKSEPEHNMYFEIFVSSRLVLCKCVDFMCFK